MPGADLGSKSLAQKFQGQEFKLGHADLLALGDPDHPPYELFRWDQAHSFLNDGGLNEIVRIHDSGDSSDPDQEPAALQINSENLKFPALEHPPRFSACETRLDRDLASRSYIPPFDDIGKLLRNGGRLRLELIRLRTSFARKRPPGLHNFVNS